MASLPWLEWLHRKQANSACLSVSHDSDYLGYQIPHGTDTLYPIDFGEGQSH
jgi:hypothetical protein